MSIPNIRLGLPVINQNNDAKRPDANEGKSNHQQTHAPTPTHNAAYQLYWNKTTGGHLPSMPEKQRINPPQQQQPVQTVVVHTTTTTTTVQQPHAQGQKHIPVGRGHQTL